MNSKIVFLFFTLIGGFTFARTGSYFTMTGDRVMINIQSGHSFNPDHDDDALRLYKAMNVTVDDSMMGKGKKLSWESAFTMIVSDRGNGQYDGTIMVYQWPGVHIDYSRREAEIRWTGEAAASIFSRLNHEGVSFEYVSLDGRLKIYSDQEQFLLNYSEYQ